MGIRRRGLGRGGCRVATRVPGCRVNSPIARWVLAAAAAAAAAAAPRPPGPQAGRCWRPPQPLLAPSRAPAAAAAAGARHRRQRGSGPARSPPPTPPPPGPAGPARPLDCTPGRRRGRGGEAERCAGGARSRRPPPRPRAAASPPPPAGLRALGAGGAWTAGSRRLPAPRVCAAIGCASVRVPCL